MSDGKYLGVSQARRLGIVDEIDGCIAQLDRESLRVLDAGGGRGHRLKFPSNAEITGIDISDDSLSARTDLSEQIVGDLQTYPLATEAFDVIVCWDVFEHLRDPHSAFLNMSNALAKGGLLVIGGPNVWSTKSLVAKATPHRFHVFAYRRLLHMPHAGEPGYPPFPTYLRLAMAPDRLAKSSVRLGLEVKMLRYYRGLEHRLPQPLRSIWSTLTSLAGLFSFSLRMADSDFCLVLQRPPA